MSYRASINYTVRSFVGCLCILTLLFGARICRAEAPLPTVPLLILQLNDPRPDERIAAVDQLAAFNTASALEPLLRTLRDREPAVRAAAARALARCDRQYLLPLRERIGNLLFELLLTDPDARVRTGAVCTLAALGWRADSRAAQPLGLLLADSDAAVRQAAIEVMGQLTDTRLTAPLLTALQIPDSDFRLTVLTALWRQPDARAADAVIAALRHDIVSVRVGVARMLGASKDTRAVLPLCTALEDRDVEVGRWAAWSLGQQEDPRAVAPLLAKLQATTVAARVRAAAAEALGHLRDARAVTPLLQAFLDENYSVRDEAAQALGQLQDPHSVEMLLEALKDKNTHIRQSAVKALGHLRDARSIEPLLAILYHDQDAEMQMVAGNALTAIAYPATVRYLLAHPITVRVPGQQLGGKTIYYQTTTEELVARMGAPAVPPLMVLLGDPAVELRRAAATVLGRLNDPTRVRALDALCTAARDQDDTVRIAAIGTLGSLRDGHAIPVLLSALQDPQVSIRGHAAIALRSFADTDTFTITAPTPPSPPVTSDTVGALIAILREPNTPWRLAAIQALTFRNDPRVSVALLALPPNADPTARAAALQALSTLSANPPLTPVMAALRDADAGVRAAALHELAVMVTRRTNGMSAAVPPLIALLDDPEMTVREQAIYVLGRLGDVRAVSPLLSLLEAPDTRAWAAKSALANIGAPATAPLLDLLAHGSATARAAAADVLGEMHAARAVPALLALLDDENFTLRLAVVQALGTIGKPAREGIRQALADTRETIRETALCVLAAWHDPADLDTLITALNDPAPAVQRAAVTALAAFPDDLPLPGLRKALAGPAPELRAAAIVSVATLGRRAIPLLLPLLHDENPDIRAATIGALRAISKQDFGENADQWQQWWQTQK